MIRQLESHRLRAGAAMWSAIAVSGIVLAVLLARGWGRSAWSLALGLLLLSCLGVCTWAVVAGERSSRVVKREMDPLYNRPDPGPSIPKNCGPKDPGHISRVGPS